MGSTATCCASPARGRSLRGGDGLAVLDRDRDGQDWSTAMDPVRCDRLTRAFGRALSRRQTLAALVAGGLGATAETEAKKKKKGSPGKGRKQAGGHKKPHKGKKPHKRKKPHKHKKPRRAPGHHRRSAGGPAARGVLRHPAVRRPGTGQHAGGLRLRRARLRRGHPARLDLPAHRRPRGRLQRQRQPGFDLRGCLPARGELPIRRPGRQHLGRGVPGRCRLHRRRPGRGCRRHRRGGLLRHHHARRHGKRPRLRPHRPLRAL